MKQRTKRWAMTLRNLATGRSAEDTDEGPLPVERLEAVKPRFSAPILDGAAQVAEGTAPAVVELGHDVTPDLPWRSVYLVAGVMVATAILAQIDIRLGLTFGATVCAGVGVRWVDRHITWSFGEGFIGYRGDPGWPRGVQEDDDVHWNWNVHPIEPQTDRL